MYVDYPHVVLSVSAEGSTEVHRSFQLTVPGSILQVFPMFSLDFSSNIEYMPGGGLVKLN